MMKKNFSGKALLLDRNDINTDEIIPAKYLTEITKMGLQPHLLEDLRLDGFDPAALWRGVYRVIVTRANFGRGSSREHAVWALEINGITMVVAESFARIFRQNMFNNGLLAVELSAADIDIIFAMGSEVEIQMDLESGVITVTAASGEQKSFSFQLNDFDRELVLVGGWLAYSEKHY